MNRHSARAFLVRQQLISQAMGAFVTMALDRSETRDDLGEDALLIQIAGLREAASLLECRLATHHAARVRA
ncbi:MAG: hypothetical protein JO256_09170 [Alphaproteobacteria bacterium]|nr:hypothetical protein [Alphaproteobacteria bacterium]